MIKLEQYLKDITLEIKTDVKKMLEENKGKYRNIENFSLQSQVLIGDPSDEYSNLLTLKKRLNSNGNNGIRWHWKVCIW